MANRLVNNVYILDSLNGAGQALLGVNSASWHDDAYVNAVVFWGSGTTSCLELVYATDTTNSACVLCVTVNSVAGSTVSTQFSEPQRFAELRLKTLTAGTAWIYFS